MFLFPIKKTKKYPINVVEEILSKKKGDAVMRIGIDAYNQINKLYGTQTNIKTSRMQNSSVSMGKDQLSISQTGRDYQIAKNAVSEASDIREDKVAKLKAMVDSGSYSVKPEDFANKLLNAMM